MESFPPSSPSPPSPPPEETQRKRAWPLLLGLGAVALVLGYAYVSNRPATERDYNFSDLPEWFNRDHRVRPAERVMPVAGIGMLMPPAIEPSKQFSPQWLEENFTHYVADDSFVWSAPKLDFPSHGKILGGTKVISSGKQVGEFTLICAVSNDGRAMNLFMQTRFLQDRSKGPPELQDD